MRRPRLCWEIRQGRKYLSRYEHPSQWDNYRKPKNDPWSKALKRPYDREDEGLLEVSKITIKHVHELEMIKSLLTAIMNTLDEQKELMEDHSEMLDDLMYALYKDEE